MKNKSLLILFISILTYCFLSFQTVFAHSSLVSSNPEDGAVVSKPLKVIALEFDTDLQDGSTLFLKDGNGTEINPDSISVIENRLEASFNEPLPANTYEVNWEVIGADGHVITNMFTFTVEQSADGSDQLEEENPETSDEQQTNDDADGQLTEDDSEQQTANAENTTENQSPSAVIYIIIIIAAAAGLIAWLVLGRKKK